MAFQNFCMYQILGMHCCDVYIYAIMHQIQIFCMHINSLLCTVVMHTVVNLNTHSMQQNNKHNGTLFVATVSKKLLCMITQILKLECTNYIAFLVKQQHSFYHSVDALSEDLAFRLLILCLTIVFSILCLWRVSIDAQTMTITTK